MLRGWNDLLVMASEIESASFLLSGFKELGLLEVVRCKTGKGD